MKKLLIGLLMVCLLVIGYMVGTKDTNVTFEKVYSWAGDTIPKKLSEMYTIKSYDIVENNDGTIDVILHCNQNKEDN